MRDARMFSVRRGSTSKDAHKASEVATKELLTTTSTACTMLLFTNTNNNNASSLPTSLCAVMLPITIRGLNGTRLQG